MQLTEQEVLEKQQELENIALELEETLKEQRVAKEFGDASENTELEAATQKAKYLNLKKYELEEQLSDYELIEVDKGPRLTIGSYVRVQKIDESGNPLGESRIFMLSSEGTTHDADIEMVLNKFSSSGNGAEMRVTKKQRLGINSALGSAILNGTSGVYHIQTINGGVHYKVTKEVAGYEAS